MRLLKTPALLALAFTVPAQAEAQTNPTLIAKTMEAATSCVLAASKSGADQGRFDNRSEWILDIERSGVRHAELPVTVTFPRDDDGVARICVVQATLASQGDQAQVQSAFEVLLKKKPLKQNNSVIWMLNPKAGPRGLQIFPDKKSEQPNIRLIGAAF